MEKPGTLDDYIKMVRFSYFFEPHLFGGFLGVIIVIIIASGVAAYNEGLPIFFKYEGFVLAFIILVSYVLYKTYNVESHLAKKISRVECLECLDYIPFDRWECPCDDKVNRSIFIGCDNCGTKYGFGELAVRSLKCNNCGHQLWFEDEYNIKNWSILGKGEIHEKKQITKKRDSLLRWYSYAFLFIGLFGLALTIFSFYRRLPSSPVLFQTKQIQLEGFEEGFPVLMEWLMLIGGLGGSLIFYIMYRLAGAPPKFLVKNPKYRSRDDGEQD